MVTLSALNQEIGLLVENLYKIEWEDQKIKNLVTPKILHIYLSLKSNHTVIDMSIF